jgi:rod shape-determining protein MreD
MPFDYALMHQMLPSLLLNLAFALLIYVPVRKYLERIAAAGKPEAEE